MLTNTLILFCSVGLVLGFLAGVVEWISFVDANRYFEYRMSWLAFRSFASTITAGMIFGGSFGLVLGGLASVATRKRDRSRFARAGSVLGALALCALIVVAGVWAAVTLVHRPPDGARSIILISVDTQRADHIGAYGYSRDTTPHLDELVSSGQLFLEAYAHAPVTSSSFSSILSGYRPRETGTYGNHLIQPRMNTVAEYLSNAGYATAAVVSNYVLHKRRNFELGFDHYDDRMDDPEPIHGSPEHNPPERVGANTTRAALEWIEAHGESPFFLWVHFQDPHGPYTPPERLADLFAEHSSSGVRLGVSETKSGEGAIPFYQKLGEHRDPAYYVSQYDAEIRHFDESLFELVEGIRERGLWEDSLVIFTADHGEAMGEHDYYFAHGDHLYRNQLHVPLVVWAKEARAGLRSDAIVQHADILPTVLAFAGIQPATRLPGRNLLDPDPGDARVLSEAVVGDDYKCSLIAREGQLLFDGRNGEVRGFDGLEPDSAEGRALVRFMKKRCAHEDRPAVKPPSNIDPDEREHLKALGYVD